MRTAPWHSPNESVYHNNTECKAGVALLIASREGTGGKRMCDTCAKLNGEQAPRSPSAVIPMRRQAR